MEIYDLSEEEKRSEEFVWERKGVRFFNELIVSWNGFRPSRGKWTFFVRLLKEGRWSPWLPYAEWGAYRQNQSQKTFKSAPEGSFAQTYQDAVTVREGLCEGFSVKISADEGSDLRQLHSLYACLSNRFDPPVIDINPLLPVSLKNVPLQSQMVLDHPRHKDLCSPTSTTTAINYLLGRRQVDPVRFAQSIHDAGFDIYGNWILNTAEAYCRLAGAYRTFAARLSDFNALHAQLLRGHPVVASVKGSIPGAPKPYPSGHLLCITGYDPAQNAIQCVDPAFPSNEATHTRYLLSDFLTAWGARRHLAYLFLKK